MEQLSQALERMQNTFKTLEHPQPMQPPGSTDADGNPNTTKLRDSGSSLGEVAVIDQPSSPPSPSGTRKGSVSQQSTLHKPSEKQALALALSKVCALQKQYGKTQAELETLVEGFCWVLGGYPMERILDALAQYVRRNSDIPAPSDLANIIDPPPQEISAAYYISLRERGLEGQYLTKEERAAMRIYQQQELKKAETHPDFQATMKALPASGMRL